MKTNETMRWHVNAINGSSGGVHDVADVNVNVIAPGQTVDGVARLIDAVPELLAACELAKTRWDFVLENFPKREWKNGDQEAYDAVSAAILKARSA